MEQYAQILNYAFIFFVSLLFIEWIVGWRKNQKVFRVLDTISSLSSGYTNIIKDVLGLVVVVISYQFLINNFTIYPLATNWLAYGITFLVIDFVGYWKHRLEHRINLLWNNHIIHHSSEEFNLACALRQEFSIFFSFYFVLLTPLAFLGIPLEVILIVYPIHLFSQFWYHTTLIHKMGILEWFLVTPSHHRVHHAINPIYLDKNFSQIFIIWDRLFGTFQAELTEEPPVYGTKRQANTWNPFLINFQHLALLLQDAYRTQKWSDKLKVFYMPTGWRPKDVATKYPIIGIDDPYQQVKYEVAHSPMMLMWFCLQFTMTGLLILYLFNHLGTIGVPSTIYYGIFLLLSIFSYTALMDLKWYALVTETIRFGLGFSFIYTHQGWFGIDQLIPFGTIIIGSYLLTSLLVTTYAFSNQIYQTTQQTSKPSNQ